MSPLLLCSVSILMLTCTFTWAAQNFVSVPDCPKDANEWNVRSEKKKCYGDTPDYLCAAIEKKVGKFGEICTKYGLTPYNKCAVLNAQTHNLDSVDCKADSGCPTDPYIPSELWKYTICYRNFYGMKTTLAQNTTPTITIADTRSKDGDSEFGAGGVVAVVVILIILIVVVVLVFFYVKNQFGFRDKVQRLYTDLRQRFQHSDRSEGHKISEAGNGEKQSTEVPLLHDDIEKGAYSDDLKNGANSDQPLYAIPEKAKTKKEQTDPAKPEKAKTKKEKIANTTDTGDTKEGHRGKHDEPDKKIEKLEELLKYLAHILERELSVNDLKEKMVIHSKSIEEHFSEPLIKELQNVKNLGDYSRLDISLVFTLLWNFCENIKPPSRGWDYEPLDNETHVGADIERIKFMWNKYCDEDLQFKHQDDVYKRIKQKYGTVAVHGDDGVRKFPPEDKEKAEGFELMKLKIQSIKLNEDCSVEKGIVITEGITSALKIMKFKNVVILKGAIGCGKTHALMAIENHFQEKKWETEWVEFQNIKEITSKEKPTIILCDNLCGRFGSCVFSQDDIKEIEEVLKNIENSKDNIKTVIGVHTHIFDEVKKDLKLSFLQQKNITVEIDQLSAAETLLIYKEQLKKGHCKMDSNCWFKTVGFQSVLDKLSKNQGQIGSPFLSLMYCNNHELFSDKAFSANPIHTMMQYFQRMSQDMTSSLYSCLVYLMCVQEHICEEKPQEWASRISADILKDSFEKIVTASGYVQVDNNKAALAHDILTIVLFKSAVELEKYMSPVVENFELDMMLQLLRPPGTSHNDFYCDFWDESKERSRTTGKIFVYRCASNYDGKKVVHPLFTTGFAGKKYQKYLKATSKQNKKSK